MPPAPAAPIQWQEARVVDTVTETPTARSIVLDIPGWARHLAGQHLDIRLTAPDGYQANRSYSVSSGPGEAPQITVERVVDGEVSPFLVDELRDGDTIEIRGPVGGYFVWEPNSNPLLLIGGGSGLAPLRSIWRAAEPTTPVTILYSSRDKASVIYREELARLPNVTIHLTRDTAPGYNSGRIDADSIRAAIGDASAPSTYVCGPTGFVETALTHLREQLSDPRSIRAERFG